MRMGEGLFGHFGKMEEEESNVMKEKEGLLKRHEHMGRERNPKKMKILALEQ